MELTKLVEDLRSNDFVVAAKASDAIILHFIPMADRFARSFARKFVGKRDEFQGVAYEALVVSVNRAKDSLYDDAILPYLSCSIHNALLRFAIEDSIVKIPQRAHAYRQWRHCLQLHSNVIRIENNTLCDILDCCKTEQEKQIVKLRVMGFRDPAIGAILGIGSTLVHKIRRDLWTRFSRETDLP